RLLISLLTTTTRSRWSCRTRTSSPTRSRCEGFTLSLFTFTWPPRQASAAMDRDLVRPTDQIQLSTRTVAAVSDGMDGAVTPRGSRVQAQFVALRVGDGDPVRRPLLPAVEHLGALGGQPVQLALQVRVADLDVQVHAVLHSLRLRHGLEQDARAGPGVPAVG